MSEKTPKVPNTISDAQMDSLRRRAQKAAPPLFSTEAIRQRLASNAQRDQAHLS